MDMSIVIPAHNEARYIGMTLNSLRDQGDLEIVVVADSCVDNTATIARDKGARVMEVGYGNVARAKNHGFGVLDGRETVIFLDADTSMPKLLVNHIYGRMVDKRVVGGKVVVEPSRHGRDAELYYGWVNFCSWLSQYTTKISPALTNGGGACMFGRHSWLDGLRTGRGYVFDPTMEMFEDQELIVQMYGGGKFEYIDIPCLRVTTSTRRFDEEGFLGRFVKDWVQLFGFKRERLNVR